VDVHPATEDGERVEGLARPRDRLARAGRPLDQLVVSLPGAFGQQAAVAAAWVGDVFVGRRLPGLLRDAGLVDVAADAHIRIWSPGDPYQKLLLRFAEIYRARILAGGTLTEAELDDCVHQLDVHLDRADTFTLYPTFFQAWGRKP